MALARFKKLCIDANDPSRLGAFWAAVLGATWTPHDTGEGLVSGPEPHPRIWFNRVPEPKSVKHRVHLDVYTTDLARLEALGSRVVLSEGDGRHWTVMADPEGGEYCAFLRTDLPERRLHGLVVDSADPPAQARWWAEIYGAQVVHDNSGFSTVKDVPGMAIETMDFNPVPEPKTVKNRVHWDVSTADVDLLVDAGATVLRPPGDDIAWYVVADPEGNEFCAFIDPDGGWYLPRQPSGDVS
jgi:catechol 2,3-dioxygenase-like lactoylglutathione lyase family enzyme